MIALMVLDRGCKPCLMTKSVWVWGRICRWQRCCTPTALGCFRGFMMNQ
ncbi:hypothetical protein [Moraxella lacunata]